MTARYFVWINVQDVVLLTDYVYAFFGIFL